MREQITVEEQVLINRLKEGLQNPEDARPPLDLKAINSAEEQLGFPLPPLLRELFIQIGNGGFGPGYGLLRLMGNHPKDDGAIVSTYKMSTGPDVPREYDSWHPRHIDIVDWGCNIYSVLDCTTAEGPVYRYWMDRYREESDGPLRDFGVLEANTLREWLEAWMSGVNLWERGAR
jgi:hypothetical protein